jgi:hypothetical protein
MDADDAHSGKSIKIAASENLRRDVDRVMTVLLRAVRDGIPSGGETPKEFGEAADPGR